MLRLATVNINGIRAALGRSRGQSAGLGEWLAARDADVVTLQEVRAPDALVHELLTEAGYHVVHTEAAQKGRQGVAILSKSAPVAHRVGFGDVTDEFDESGRWIESDVPLANGETLTVVSAYFPTGDAEKPEKQAEKYRYYDAVVASLPRLAAGADHAVITGDYNVGHTELDIKNWKANQKNAGFLPEERAYFEHFVGAGWVDVHRSLSGQVPGPYTWWSMRGQAFDNDAGWRIDYQWATPSLAGAAKQATVDRADSWAERWSDHAPLVIDYDL